jgi:hypothetical protein
MTTAALAELATPDRSEPTQLPDREFQSRAG